VYLRLKQKRAQFLWKGFDENAYQRYVHQCQVECMRKKLPEKLFKNQLPYTRDFTNSLLALFSVLFCQSHKFEGLLQYLFQIV
jgi:hypothetical protein